MPPITKQPTSHRSAGTGRGRLTLIVVAAIVVLPAVIVAVLYSRHHKPGPPPAPENAAERDKLAAVADQQLRTTGDLGKASEDYRQIAKLFPSDADARDNLGVVYARLGQYMKAAEITREALHLNPGKLAPYEHLGYDYMAQQHPEDAHEIIREAMARKMDSPDFHRAMYTLAFLAPLGPNQPAMADQLGWFARRPQYESYGLALASDTAAFAGHLMQARELSKRAIDSAQRNNQKETAAIWQENAALREAAFGNNSEAQRQEREGLRLAPESPEAEVEAALALAMIGDSARAEALADDAGRRRPKDTQIQSLWLPAIRAQAALNRHQAGEALKQIETALPVELGQVPFSSNLSCLYPTYVRGLAYLAANSGTAAATEFQKILDHNGIVWNCWTGALAHIGLARANVLQSQELYGEEADHARLRALMAYKDFLKLWKGADPDIPILKEVQQEVAQVQQ